MNYTKDERTAIIERLQAIEFDGGSHENLGAIAKAIHDPRFGWTIGACETLRAKLVDLLSSDGLIKPPRDVEGVPWQIGDVIEWCDGSTAEVIGIGENTLFYVDDDAGGLAEWTCASYKRHYHKPTVESVIDELLDKWPYCETPSEEERLKVKNIILKLREVMGND